jgi:hypothetical protein
MKNTIGSWKSTAAVRERVAPAIFLKNDWHCLLVLAGDPW